MSAKALWFTSFLHCSRKGPDRARKDHGYVYAAFFNSGEIKVGSTYHPRVRFKDMVNLQYDFGSANIAVVPCGSKFRSIETEFHQVMRPLRVSGRRRGVCRYEEVYKTPDYPLNCLVLKYIEAGCCPRVLETIDARVIELAAVRAAKVLSELRHPHPQRQSRLTPMILFSWTLTPNQIMALRSVSDYHQTYDRAAAKKDRKLLEGRRLNCLDIPHWSTAVRGLLREGFVRHSEVPLEKWEQGVNGSIRVRQLWELTEKGRLMLQIVAIEVEEQAKTLAIDRAQLRLLKAA